MDKYRIGCRHYPAATQLYRRLVHRAIVLGSMYHRSPIARRIGRIVRQGKMFLYLAICPFTCSVHVVLPLHPHPPLPIPRYYISIRYDSFALHRNTNVTANKLHRISLAYNARIASVTQTKKLPAPCVSSASGKTRQ